MPEITNPFNALVSLQPAIDAGLVRMQPCEVHADLQVLVDRPDGNLRITYTISGMDGVEAIAQFGPADPIDGVPCFQLGYAVAESKRGQGLAKEVVSKGIDELRNVLSQSGVDQFYVEAIVAVTNDASNRVAQHVLAGSPANATDSMSGVPIYQYVKLIKADD